jgi:multidrug transporter EmrE-like cation transporter
MYALLGGVLLTLTEALGDFALKKYALGATWSFLGLGIGVYVVLACMLAILFKHLGFAILNATWDGTSNILSMLLGAFVFQETYTIREWLGMASVGIGLFLINGSKSK